MKEEERSAPSALVITGSEGYLGGKLVATVARGDGIGESRAIVEIDRLVHPTAQPVGRQISVDLASDEAEGAVVGLGSTLQDSVVIHLAGLFVKDVDASQTGREYEHDNLVTTERLVSGLLKSPYTPRLFIFASTACVYDGARVEQPDVTDDRAVRDYARTKREAENVVVRLEQKGIRVVILRFSRIVGLGRQDLIPQDIVSDSIVEIARAAAFGRTPQFKQGNELRPYVYVDDVIAILANLAEGKGELSGRFNVTGETPMTIGEIPRIVSRVLAESGTLLSVPDARIWGGTGFVKRLSPRPSKHFVPRLNSAAEVVEQAAREYCRAIRDATRTSTPAELLRALDGKCIRQGAGRDAKEAARTSTPSDWVRLQEALDVLALDPIGLTGRPT